MQNRITLLDLLNLSGLNTDDIILVRHSVKSGSAKVVWDDCIVNGTLDMLEEYQKIQPEGFFKGKKYVLSFVGELKTTARFIGCYEIGQSHPCTKADKVSKFPISTMYDDSKNYYCNLKKTDYLADFQERLVVEWNGAKAYVQYSKAAIANKPVVAIYPDAKHKFPGYDEVCWKFDQMKQYVENEDRYPEICSALSAVNGVYLIVDEIDGKMYVGSAFGKDGILGRWKVYANSDGTGGNRGLIEHLRKNPNRYHDLSFSILKVLHRTGNKSEDEKRALVEEMLYKKKLGTLSGKHGLNHN